MLICVKQQRGRIMFNIRVLGLPGAEFSGAAALTQHRHHAETYEAAIRCYMASGDEASLWSDLAGLGIEPDEIQWHVERPGRRIRQAYAVAGTLPGHQSITQQLSP
jgi:hypothetical protein